LWPIVDFVKGAKYGTCASRSETCWKKNVNFGILSRQINDGSDAISSPVAYSPMRRGLFLVLGVSLGRTRSPIGSSDPGCFLPTNPICELEVLGNVPLSVDLSIEDAFLRCPYLLQLWSRSRFSPSLGSFSSQPIKVSNIDSKVPVEPKNFRLPTYREY